jgi:phage shock protein PspC (stress-responsive transcriptional regulator)
MSMRKVITINLNGNAYQVDEPGYEALRAYLERAESQLRGNPDRAEIVADLEQAIGDKCDTFLGSHKTVVSSVEVEQLLKEMGPVEAGDTAAQAKATGPSGEATQQAAAGSGADAKSSAQPQRRIYRLPQQGMLGGVCAGFAAYANIDVVWVRLIFVLLTFTTGIWFFVWLVMLFVMPRATTPEEIASAYGEPFNARDVMDRAKKKYSDYSPSMKSAAEDIKQGFSKFGQHMGEMGADFRRSARRQRAHARAQRRLHRRAQWDVSYGSRVAAGFTLPILSVLSAALFVAFIIALVTLVSGGTILGWTPLYFMPHWVGIVAIIVMYAIVAGPISAARHMSRRYANNGHGFGWASALDGLLWLALVAALFWTAWQFLPGVQNTFDHLHFLGRHHYTIAL